MPTPSAPLNTDNTVRLMPTSGSAISTASVTSTVVTTFESTMRRFISSRLLFIRRLLMVRESQRANTIITATHTKPVSMV